MDVLITAAAALVGSVLGVVGSWFTQSWAFGKQTLSVQREQQRRAALAWLTAHHMMYDEIARLHRAHYDGHIGPEVAGDLRSLSSREAQTALEDLRMVATDSQAIAAARVWTHMRRKDVPVGNALDKAAFLEWAEEYWVLRRAFINEVRKAMGFKPLDWERAGITQPRPDEII